MPPCDSHRIVDLNSTRCMRRQYINYSINEKDRLSLVLLTPAPSSRGPLKASAWGSFSPNPLQTQKTQFSPKLPCSVVDSRWARWSCHQSTLQSGPWSYQIEEATSLCPIWVQYEFSAAYSSILRPPKSFTSNEVGTGAHLVCWKSENNVID